MAKHTLKHGTRAQAKCALRNLFSRVDNIYSSLSAFSHHISHYVEGTSAFRVCEPTVVVTVTCSKEREWTIIKLLWKKKKVEKKSMNAPKECRQHAFFFLKKKQSILNLTKRQSSLVRCWYSSIPLRKRVGIICACWSLWTANHCIKEAYKQGITIIQTWCYKKHESRAQHPVETVSFNLYPLLNSWYGIRCLWFSKSYHVYWAENSNFSVDVI